MSAQPQTIDFTQVTDQIQHSSGKFQDDKAIPVTPEGKLLTPKQIRARARRRRKRNQHMSEQELEYLYKKPIEEWDLQELAHGRPRNAKGHFLGPAPQWIDRTVYEKAAERFTAAIRTEMKSNTVTALKKLTDILDNDDVDEKGKPVVAPGVKVDVAKFLLEHVVGKPTQRIENDVSVKLMGILGQVMVNPSEMATGNYMPAHFPGVTMQLTKSEDEDDPDDELEP